MVTATAPLRRVFSEATTGNVSAGSPVAVAPHMLACAHDTGTGATVRTAPVAGVRESWHAAAGRSMGMHTAGRVSC